VIDPEIERDIVSLGMVYGIEVADRTAAIWFTLTSPGCPLGSVLVRAVEAAVQTVPEVDDVTVHLVWEPRWHPDMIEDTRIPE
jgi:metal-sulfur cluster biosynthetic enzyme